MILLKVLPNNLTVFHVLMYSGTPTEIIKFDANKFYMLSFSLDKKVGFENCVHLVTRESLLVCKIFGKET